jgi:hypothetical protein
VSVCVCVCVSEREREVNSVSVCVCVSERERERGDTNSEERLHSITSKYLPTNHIVRKVSIKVSSIVFSYIEF